MDRWDEPTRNDPIARDPVSLDAVALGEDPRLVSAQSMLLAMGLTLDEPHGTTCEVCEGRSRGESPDDYCFGCQGTGVQS